MCAGVLLKPRCWGTLNSIGSLHRPMSLTQLHKAIGKRLGFTHKSSAKPTRTKKLLVKRTLSRNGRPQVTGIPAHLRESASYPSGFGFAIAALIQLHGKPSRSLDACMAFCVCMRPRTLLSRRWIRILTMVAQSTTLSSRTAGPLQAGGNCSERN